MAGDQHLRPVPTSGTPTKEDGGDSRAGPYPSTQVSISLEDASGDVAAIEHEGLVEQVGGLRRWWHGDQSADAAIAFGSARHCTCSQKRDRDRHSSSPDA